MVAGYRVKTSIIQHGAAFVIDDQAVALYLLLEKLVDDRPG